VNCNKNDTSWYWGRFWPHWYSVDAKILVIRKFMN